MFYMIGLIWISIFYVLQIVFLKYLIIQYISNS